MLSFFVNADLIYILFNNAIEVDLQGVTYNPRTIGDYYLEQRHLPKFLKFLELNLLSADSILADYSGSEATALLMFVHNFKDKVMEYDYMQEILKQFAKNGIDLEKLGAYYGKNLYEILKDSKDKEEILSLLKIK